MVPAYGVNCLIGPGDSGKSTIFDAIDLCMGARRTVGDVAHKSRWFKQQGIFEGIARDIVGPRFAQASPDFQQHMNNLFGWAHEH